jgi:hypothetical protein
LIRDRAAITAAILLKWSNGQVEGQVHRLKLIKRQMYGRASFKLLCAASYLMSPLLAKSLKDRRSARNLRENPLQNTEISADIARDVVRTWLDARLA